MKKRLALGLAMIFLFSIGLTGCGTKAEEQAKAGDKSKPVTIRFATWDTEELLKIEQDIAKQFEALHPGVKVQVEAYGDGFDQKLVAAFGAKVPPDVMYMWDFPTYSKSLEPLDEMMKNDPSLNVDDFYPGLFSYFKINGATYGLPAGFSTHVIYYNKTLFDAAGVPYPQEGWTWNDFKETAKKLTDKSKKQFGFGLRATWDPYDFEQFLWSNGTSYISADGKTIDGYMNSPKAVEAVEMFSNMAKDGSAVIVGLEKQQSGSDIFKANKLGMWENGIWSLDGFKTAKVNFGVVGLPTPDGGSAKSVISASAVSIAKDSKNKEMAWEFVKYFTAADAIKMRKGDLPVRKSVVAETKIDQDPLIKPFYLMLEKADNTPAFLLNPKWAEIQKNLALALEKSFTEQKNVKANLDQAVKDSARFLQ